MILHSMKQCAWVASGGTLTEQDWVRDAAGNKLHWPGDDYGAEGDRAWRHQSVTSSVTL